MAEFEIPLVPEPQVIRIDLAGTEYILRFSWCDAGELSGWFLDIQSADETTLVAGLNLTAGADILGQLAELGIGGGIWTAVGSDVLREPDFANLGQAGKVFFVTP